jgi:hypothetical protein
MSKLGLVTVLYKSDSVLEGFFASISRQTYRDYHLYLIDNTPADSTRQLIDQLSRRYPVTAYTHIENAANIGVAAGNNQGIKLSIADNCSHTILLNNDIEFDQDHLFASILARAVNQGEQLIIPKILYHDTRKIWMAGGHLLKQKGIVFHVGDHQPDGNQYNTPARFTYAPTCFMLIDNRVFAAVGIMDESYFVYYDDTDFVYRASLKGYTIYYMPELVVLHKVSSLTGGGESLVSIYYNTRNRIYFIRKNFPPVKQIIPLVYTLVTRGIRWFLYDKQQARKLVQGIGDGFKMHIS